ncbi:Sybindin-like protein [Histomonas meleagridis]|uniref:Sybindin-like protein n=1 Tax=Histomonas meleagridis TaxID=135588 RepID=UPI00355A3A74|nr:Sybindin-like protein [Histomonas meleagridis]KAH0802767.1 Sybindin-like protein [Histomonas meleagridis]
MVVYSAMVLNSSGGLVFFQNYHPNAQQLNSDEVIIIGATLHSLHAISVEVSPVQKSSGFTEFECTTWKLSCLQTITGLKFMIFTDLQHSKAQDILHNIYALYTDYVLKNPFYTLDMPVANSCQKFVDEVQTLISGING